MPPVDAVLSLRIINNQRLFRATHRGEYRDLGGALCITSDSPQEEWNCLEGFTTNERMAESLLDVGFSLLRAFDRPPAVRLTPLDRPRKIGARLQRRGLVQQRREVAMALLGAANDVALNRDVSVQRVQPDDVRAFVDVEAGSRSGPERRLLLQAAFANINDPAHVFLLAELAGEPVGVALVLRDGAMAGIYSVKTSRAQRRKGVATALMVRAIEVARDEGADTVCVETGTADPMRLFSRLGFSEVHASALWSLPEPGGRRP
jgi:GNAT superfamily N-acetyltransferase